MSFGTAADNVREAAVAAPIADTGGGAAAGAVDAGSSASGSPPPPDSSPPQRSIWLAWTPRLLVLVATVGAILAITGVFTPNDYSGGNVIAKPLKFAAVKPKTYSAATINKVNSAVYAFLQRVGAETPAVPTSIDHRLTTPTRAAQRAAHRRALHHASLPSASAAQPHPAPSTAYTPPPQASTPIPSPAQSTTPTPITPAPATTGGGGGVTHHTTHTTSSAKPTSVSAPAEATTKGTPPSRLPRRTATSAQ